MGKREIDDVGRLTNKKIVISRNFKLGNARMNGMEV